MKEYDIEFYGKVAYDLEQEAWKRTTPIKVPFNGKICQLDFIIKDASPMYTQIKYNLKDYGISLQQIPDHLNDLYKESVQRQKDLFDKYLREPDAMMKLFEEAIIEDFYEERENLLEDETEITEKIRTADAHEKILDMVHLRELTLTFNQIRIIGDCDFCDIDYGVGITFDRMIDVGSVEMIYR